jgi:hypothetical protein
MEGARSFRKWLLAGVIIVVCGGRCLNPESAFLVCQDAMLVVLKSLMPACLFNIIGFGSTFKTLFPSSQTYNEVRREQVWDQEGSRQWIVEERRKKKRRDDPGAHLRSCPPLGS